MGDSVSKQTDAGSNMEVINRCKKGLFQELFVLSPIWRSGKISIGQIKFEAGLNLA
jgi:hypothetical protein